MEKSDRLATQDSTGGNDKIKQIKKSNNNIALSNAIGTLSNTTQDPMVYHNYHYITHIVEALLFFELRSACTNHALISVANFNICYRAIE